MDAQERRAAARTVTAKLAQASGPVAFVLPAGGIEAWDRPGEPLHDPQGLQAFCEEVRSTMPRAVRFEEIDAHINDAAFSDTVLRIFDQWVADGHIPPGP